MTTRGTPKYCVRIPDDLADEARETIERRNDWTRGRKWTLVEFIRVAIAEKIAKMDRSRRPRPRGPATKAKKGAG